MKTQNKKLQFNTSVITELDLNQLNNINGGTSFSGSSGPLEDWLIDKAKDFFSWA